MPRAPVVTQPASCAPGNLPQPSNVPSTLGGFVEGSDGGVKFQGKIEKYTCGLMGLTLRALGAQRKCQKRKTDLEEAVWRPLPYIEGKSEEG